MDHDKQFYVTFGIIIVVLHVLALAMLVLANFLDDQEAIAAGNKYQQQQVVERIQSPGQVAVAAAGAQRTSAAPAPSDPVTAAATPADPGQQTYESACFACHGTGAAGAPRIGDVEAWAPRIAKGRDVLIEHAINGYQGDTGFMPAKGGQMQLSDEAVIAALDYMVGQSK